MRILSSVLLGSVILSGCAGTANQASQAPTPIAVTQLKPTEGNQANGAVSFMQKGDKILVDARIDGLTPGLHGFHVHEKGDCSAPDAMSAGGHFNPSTKSHGDPAHADHHAGDLGNLNANAAGNAVLQLAVAASDFSLSRGAPNSIVGKALIVHADPDDYKTQPTGNAGKRVACGVISLQ
ncbi:superoxide dismutase family protein [Noviherbaspirillum saxi]|uniref:Superoxide dismutase [Cu-Zn] n=1 Tax=Noviherbaspirillum saxi TaxID=2320863 RepID=A0A3A3G027_9BURK|nr:superoxide dismutase family protein [Noviherbaspirillum saxi]RJF99811.1 superoxide dismutase family protein [Noviherbaspirillum saxi]